MKKRVMALTMAALMAASLTACGGSAKMCIRDSTKSMKNREKAEEINQNAKRMIKIGISQADEIYEKVLEQLV